MVFKRAATEMLIDLLKYRRDYDKTKDGDYLVDFLGMLNDCLESIKTANDYTAIL